MLDSEKLNAFRAVAEEGGFSRAAEKLYRTQPAVSQAVKALEEELGEALFLRLGRSVELTPAGRVLLEHVEQAFDTLERGRARIEGLKEVQEGTLTIAASDTTACYLLPEVLGQFHRRYPRVEVRISNHPSPLAAEEVVTRRADVGIVTLPVEHPKLAAEPLVVREDVAICAANHPLAGRKGVSFAALLDYPLLLLDPGSNTRSFIDQRVRECGKTPQIAMELGSIEVIKRLVQLDFGVSIVPRIAVRDEVAEGRLRALRVFAPSECRTLGVIYPAKGVPSPAAGVFVEMLKGHLGGRGGL